MRSPLHGEAGLRERFAIEIASLRDGDRLRAERALELVARLHSGDRRQREPYVNHLLRVAICIFTYYGVRDTDVICAALLHDAVEDHAGELAEGGGQQEALTAEVSHFGDRVAEMATAVTNPPQDPGRDRHEHYREHVAASLEASPCARVINASDFTDNGVGLIHTTVPRLGRLADKYAPLVPVLADLIARSDTIERRGQGTHPWPARQCPAASRSDQAEGRSQRGTGMTSASLLLWRTTGNVLLTLPGGRQ
jgi:HD domain